MPLSNTPKFLADRYREARPPYPATLFRLLEGAFSAPPRFLDLGCGTGLSTLSFLRLGISTAGDAIDPDPKMLALAETELRKSYPEVRFQAGRAEAIPLADASVDLVLVGSAVHWFDLSRAQPEIARVLRPGGRLLVFEYQFPKCLDSTELAETVRRRFNLEWKAPVQTPRGTLAEILAPFARWKKIGEDRPEWIETLSLERFLGHLFSQSRYLHAEEVASDPIAYRAEIERAFAPYFEEKPLRFDLKPRAIAYKKPV